MSEAVVDRTLTNDPTHVHEDHHDHPAHLQHHFDTEEQQFDASKIGMWLFLATEILLFGGLFCAYSVYRANHPEIFMYADQFLDRTLGGINTAVLITSSFTMAWAVRLSQLGKRTAMCICLAFTILCGFGFLGIKFVEYKHKWEHGLLWGTHYISQEHHAADGDAHMEGSASGDAAEKEATSAESQVNTTGAETGTSGAETGTAADVAANAPEKTKVPQAAVGPAGLVAPAVGGQHDYGPDPKNVHIFFGIYFAMTGLHALHVIMGMGAIAWVLIGGLKGKYGPDYFTPVDLVGLYWHLVDLIWIFLFPLLYLIH